MPDSGKWNVMGVKFWPTHPFIDKRGLFRNLPTAAESSCSFTGKRHTLRGLHGDPAMGKLVTCLHGAVFDVVADVRPDSPTYGRYDCFILADHNPTVLFVPPGCAHGFFTLTDDVVFYYAKTVQYSAEREFQVNYADPTLNISWPGCDDLIISDKDRVAPLLTGVH